MIPQAALDAWRQKAPWPNEIDIEQDLILTRLIIDIATDPVLGEALAFRGGTCLHKLHAPRAPRYSNDLDYVRTDAGPVRHIMDSLRGVASGVGLQESGYAQKRESVAMKFDAEPTGGIGRIRVKVEINTREIEPFGGRIHRPLRVDNPWFNGRADVLTFELEEIVGTKLRALYQRRKGRDLFDLWFALEKLAARDQLVVDAFAHYLRGSGLTVPRADFEMNLVAKLRHRGFRTDLDQLLIAPPAGYTVDHAAEIVQQRLIHLLD
jgi:predicted nucleotidyltransferase component of viral defense system